MEANHKQQMIMVQREFTREKMHYQQNQEDLLRSQ
jgi:hypothetical protein